MPRKKTEQPLGTMTGEVSDLNTSLEDPSATVNAFKKVDENFALSALNLNQDLLKESVAFSDFSNNAGIAFNNLTNAVTAYKKDKFIRKEDGSVNWRAMVGVKHLYINSKYTDVVERKYGKPIGELTPNDVEDNFNLIKLSGIKEIAELRGFHSVDYQVIEASRDYVLTKCTIEWKDFEGSGIQTFSALADACPQNTDDLMSLFLAAAAENRSFIRAVRSFLGIHVTGKDEICPEEKILENKKAVSIGTPETSKPLDALKGKLEKAGRTFEQLKLWWAKEGHAEALEWNGFSDIPKSDIWTILGRIDKK
jgi:hypothetical protein